MTIRVPDFSLPPMRGARPVEMDTTPVACLGEELDEIWWRGRQWAVTSFGVECLDGTYAFEAKRLAEGCSKRVIAEQPLYPREEASPVA